MMTEVTLILGDALLIIDVQNDFCRGGALAVPDGDEVVPVLNQMIELAGESGAPVFASRDWHPRGHQSFDTQGGPWPAHCVRETTGARFHPELQLPPETRVVSKGTAVDEEGYSAFRETELETGLKRLGVKRLWVGGLALEYCVQATVLDALEKGFEVVLILSAIRAINVDPGDDLQALNEMLSCGAQIGPGVRDRAAA